jgi:hypothetical protein
MMRESAFLGLEFAGPRILARGLIEVPVDAEAHGEGLGHGTIASDEGPSTRKVASRE